MLVLGPCFSVERRRSMPDKDVQSVHFRFFQKDIVDDGLLDGLDVSILYLFNVVSDDFLVVESRVE